MAPNRQTRGVPTGGQFTPSAHQEPGTSLASSAWAAPAAVQAHRRNLVTHRTLGAAQANLVLALDATGLRARVARVVPRAVARLRTAETAAERTAAEMAVRWDRPQDQEVNAARLLAFKSVLGTRLVGAHEARRQLDDARARYGHGQSPMDHLRLDAARYVAEAAE